MKKNILSYPRLDLLIGLFYLGQYEITFIFTRSTSNYLYYYLLERFICRVAVFNFLSFPGVHLILNIRLVNKLRLELLKSARAQFVFMYYFSLISCAQKRRSKSGNSWSTKNSDITFLFVVVKNMFKDLLLIKTYLVISMALAM